ncbi:Type I restriction-modification system, specificity subunit S [Pseudomonas chlororaphis subsp. aureofaciens]|uniref:restriction endonuclease subunit S n=1 Tax=Pseudomonas chlororaphis TaxID=587753 RepID=UPI000F564EBC|nr:restriction endonuclease subunit S [Pseudomonas chlororaphis]AZD85465.1 Type I restriction-modification system, specificity subunit S [Pseudomonas chlororaphis subsp. aureofaciens]
MKPGYKQTDVGVIPEDWCYLPITKVARLESGHTPSKRRSDYWGGGINWISLFDSKGLSKNEIFTTEKTITEAGLNNSSARLLPAGTVVFSRTATVGKASVMASSMATSQDFANYICGPYLHNIFLVYLFRSMGRTWKTLMAGSIHNTIYMPTFKALKILVPPLSEQKAIAKTLSDTDELIESLEQLLTKKRQIKQGTMQELLTGQHRLPGFSGAWGVKRLGSICDISMGRTPSRLNSVFWGAGYVWLSISDLKSKVVSSSKEEITPLAAAAMRPVRKGTLLMSFKLSIGRLCFAGCDLFTNEAICSFNNPRANTDFLYYVLGRTDFSLYGKQAVKGYTLNKESLMGVEVPYPSLDEQTAIASVLSAMDGEISALETKLKNVRHLKQGMMQELLTGRIRLV